MLSPEDLKAARRSFDSRTWERGREYAAKGAVLSLKEEDAPKGGVLWLDGLVKGSRPAPYAVSVEIFWDRDSARLDAVEGSCDCPVGIDCKHAASLVWVAAFEGSSTTASDGLGPARPGWDTEVDRLLAVADDEEGVPGALRLAVQFEVVLPAGGAAETGPRVRLRPVAEGRSGTWVRTGVSWQTVREFSSPWRRAALPASQIALLSEILALGTLDASPYYSRDVEVWLDTIGSRRIWDLLRDAQAAGIALVGVGRPAPPVTVLAEMGHAVLDASRMEDPPGIALGPRVRIGERVLEPAAGWVPIGSPVHGIGWWDPPAGEGVGPPPLTFAALDPESSDIQRALLSTTGWTVPAGDVPRLFADLYPRLARAVPVVSLDGSVPLPEVPPDYLVLSLRHFPGHLLGVEWSTGPEAGGRVRVGAHTRQRCDEDVVAALDAATELVRRHPSGRWLLPAGDRLEPAVDLEGMEAVRFLTELLPRIETVPRLLVEIEGEAPDYKEAAEAPVVNLVNGPSRHDDWFDLALEVTVGGEEVPFERLFSALASEERHLLLPSGTWFSLEAEELRGLAALIAEARALHAAEGDRITVSRLQAGLWEDLVELGVLTTQATAWEDAVRRLAAVGERPSLEPPAGLKARLRPYQKVGFEWLAYLYELGLGGILADDMGLGKTIQALALVCHVRQHELHDGPFLVVAPTSVVGNWASECRRFAPHLRVEAVRATAPRRTRTLFELAGEADVLVTSYALFRLEYDDYEKVDWAGAFFDEAQVVKNASSQSFRRAKTLPVGWKVAITGTPMENHLGELWSLLSITAPGLLGSPESFGEYYRSVIERVGSDPEHRAERLALLRRRIRPLLLRRTKEEVAADLPPKQEQVVELELAPRHARLYQTYLQRERQRVLGLLDDMRRNRFEILKSLTVMRQASLSMALLDEKHDRVPSAKLDALVEMVGEVVADGHRALVFSQFTRFLTMARKRLEKAGVPHCYLDGRTRRRDAVIEEFRSGEAPVFLISLKAGGYGLNLTEADYCFILDPWWNPATEAQAVDRTHRIGQRRRVMVYRLVSAGTIEEKVMAMKARKAALVASVLEGGGFESGALSAADIRGLLE